MRLREQGPGAGREPRYPSGMLPKVAALANRLQHRREETLTASEIEAIGAEVGLDRSAVREALTRLIDEQPQAPARVAAGDGRIDWGRGKGAEFWWQFAAYAFPWVWGLIAASSLGDMRAVGRPLFFWGISPLPLALLIGFIAGKAKTGFIAAGALVLALVLGAAPHGMPSWQVLLTLTLGIPALGTLGVLGSMVRERLFPLSPGAPTRSRPELLEALFDLLGQLEGQKQHRAFLSVDVAGSSEMKQNGPELAVEYSFGQFRRWAEEIVREHGGELHSAAGDGMMCAFAADADAIRAARRLQEDLPRFNAEQNRLPVPFCIRCGVSAGDVAIEPGLPLGHLHSPVIDRAAALQKRADTGDILVSGEVAAAALTELGGVAALPEAIAGEPAFSWRASGHLSDERQARCPPGDR